MASLAADNLIAALVAGQGRPPTALNAEVLPLR
jgi:hypothetical protein